MANTKVTGGVIADGAITAAKIASGALDGILGTYLSTNAYATESYVTTAVNNLIDAAPASLDTLNELAAALGDDANFATTVTNSLATKLNLSGGTLTGDLIVNTNVGIGATPATSTWPSLQFRNGNGITAFPTTNIPAVYFTSNAVYDGGFKYSTSNPAWITEMDAYNNNFAIKSAISGTAGNSISWLERFRITSAGNVGIGTSSPADKLSVAGNINVGSTNFFRYNGDTGLVGSGTGISGGTANQLGIRAANDILFSTGGVTERMRVTSGGNVLINTTSAQGARKLVISGGSDGAIYTRGSAGSANVIHEGGHIEFYNQAAVSYAASIGLSGPASGATNDIVFNTYNGAWNERMRIATGGQIGMGGSHQASVTTSIWGPTQTSSTYSLICYNSNGFGLLSVRDDGTVNVLGSLSKGSGSFKIDHPLEEKKDTHHLVHSFVESPQANNIYRGKVQLVNGVATVNLDEVSTMTEGTFVALNRDIHTYTSNESDWDAVRGKVEGNILTIECQNTSSTAIVSWLVIGERQDKHMYDTQWTDENGKVIVEPEKTNIDINGTN